MKQLLAIFLLFLSVIARSQMYLYTVCYSIQFKNRNLPDSIALKLTPEYRPQGFYLVNNGVYDLIIDGKKYFQSILCRIEKDKFYIAHHWESESQGEKLLDTLRFAIDQKIQVRMLTNSKGGSGLPMRTKVDDYQVSIVPATKYCNLKYLPINTTGKQYLGHFYFTAYGLMGIRLVKDRPYLVEPRGEFILRRN